MTQNKHHSRILVTSALPYVNNVPHLGNLVCVVSADVYTRFLRLMKKDVISVLGTDEHGTTSETKAIEEGLTPKELCDKYYKIHKEIYEWFECEYDCFGRTSSKENAETTIDIFNKLKLNGFISEESMDQPYCEKDKRFLADRFVEGECPKCHYANARGDQCENCGALLNATELINPKCKICKSVPIIKSSMHLFIDLPKLEPELQVWISSVDNNWSDNARTMTMAWFREGLRKRCITRDLKWGIHVPLQGFENKVFYSWFDAPIGYIGITKENKENWKDYWMNPTETNLVQFMGKDNIPFHTILFPAFLIGTRDNYTLMSEISVNEFLNYESGQFSKSRNIGVFGDDAMNTGISADVFRYYLMINRPEKTDTEFTWDDFQKKNNSELVANIGNLVNRTVVFINKSYDGKVPQGNLNESDNSFLENVKLSQEKISRLINEIAIKDSLKEIMHISKLGNQYLQENEPWKNPDENRRTTCFYVLSNFVKDLAILIFPYMPEASKKILRQLNLKENVLDWSELSNLSVKSGHKINPGELLFKKIEDADLKILKEKFSGKKGKTGKIVNTENTDNIHTTNTTHTTHTTLNVGHTENIGIGNLQLRVGKIIDIKRHPNAEKLYIEKLDFGDETRQIVSGLVPYYTEDELLGKNIIIVTNLEPANLRGEESNGMLLAAEEKGVVGLLRSEDDVGSYVYADDSNNTSNDYDFEKIKNLNKINIKEFSSMKLHVKDGKVFCNGLQLRTKKGNLSVEKVANGQVR